MVKKHQTVRNGNNTVLFFRSHSAGVDSEGGAGVLLILNCLELLRQHHGVRVELPGPLPAALTQLQPDSPPVSQN